MCELGGKRPRDACFPVEGNRRAAQVRVLVCVVQVMSMLGVNAAAFQKSGYLGLVGSVGEHTYNWSGRVQMQLE